MSTSVYGAPGHPVSRVVEGVCAELSGVAQTPLFAMPASELGRTVVAATRMVAQAQELLLRLTSAAETAGLGDASGATSTANWFASQTRVTRREAHRLSRLAAALDGPCPRVREALADGALVVEQAHVITDAVAALPDDLDPDLVARVEEHLVTLGLVHDAVDLRILGRRALEVIAPEVAEAHEQKVLEAEERDAAASARLTFSPDGHGKVYGRFTLPEAQGEMFRKQLMALAAPKAQHATAGQDQGTDEDVAEASVRRPSPERMGAAFVEWIERYPADRLPYAGGVAATVVVTMDHETLLGQTGTGTLDTGATITGAQARRIACEAGIIPTVLGAASQVLDLGRKTRFHTEPQRIAIATRDKTCTATGCDTPPGLCHVHHDTPWHHGGGTSVSQGRLLCPKHHRRAHDPTYDTTHHPDGQISFHRRE